MTVYVSSDLHLGHRNLMRLEGRRAARWGDDVERMDADLIDEAHGCVCNGDTLILVGDLTLANRETARAYLARIMPERPSGRPGKLRIVPGNHDRRVLHGLLRDGQMPSPHIEVLGDIVTMGHAGRRLVLCHYPLESWPGMANRPEYSGDPHRTEGGTIHLHGHSHGHGRAVPNRLDVGWDAHGRILTLDEAIASCLSC